MLDLNESDRINQIYFDYLRMHFSKVPVRYALSLRLHPEDQVPSIFLSYRDIVHYFNFNKPEDLMFFTFRTRANQGIASEFKEKHISALNSLGSEKKARYDKSFGNSEFIEKKIMISPGVEGVETIAETLFYNSEPLSNLERNVFPFIFPAFLQPSNEIIFKMKKVI